MSVRLTQFPGDSSARYVFASGLLHVSPFIFTFETRCKARWIGQTLSAALAREFHRDDNADAIRRAIESGRLTVNKAVDTRADHIFAAGDVLYHRVHRHEPPLPIPIDNAGRYVHVIDDADDVIAVNKPPSLPVHPCGVYWHMTVTAIMRRAGYGTVHAANRLDRLVSGVLLLTKTRDAAAKLALVIRKGQMRKTYIARVRGRVVGSRIVDAPIAVVSAKKGEHVVTAADDPRGKAAVTEVTVLSTDGDTSLVSCRPQTGRTHQIRLHLAHIGHPIVNDAVYGGRNDQDNSYRCAHAPTHSEWSIDADCDECASRRYYTGEPHHYRIALHALRYDIVDEHERIIKSYQTEMPEWANNVK